MNSTMNKKFNKTDIINTAINSIAVPGGRVCPHCKDGLVNVFKGLWMTMTKFEQLCESIKNQTPVWIAEDFTSAGGKKITMPYEIKLVGMGLNKEEVEYVSEECDTLSEEEIFFTEADCKKSIEES